MMEQFLIECRKTKTKVIALANNPFGALAFFLAVVAVFSYQTTT